MMHTKTIGLVGGLSWVSTLEYYRRINQLMNRARGGHYSAHIFIDSVDEGLFLDAQRKDPSEESCALIIADAVGRLQAAGAEIVALCANGLHRFLPAIRRRYPQVEIVDLAVAVAAETAAMNIRRLGILGVEATMSGDFYPRALAEQGMIAVVPNAAERAEIHDIILDELTRNRFTAASREYVRAVIGHLDADAVLLACTELPLLVEDAGVGGKAVLSSVELHCRAITARALAA
ncbi:aspartate racemase [Neisseria sp. HSC-16F19]|nr:amino acid racemase [Neisseria sp. HSC-16F19]MCP2040289.1 aspartate racemase [Neisseria sp. HSC-16F19]